jgi:CubicO group peptidase (beta-lactamase class C family)
LWYTLHSTAVENGRGVDNSKKIPNFTERSFGGRSNERREHFPDSIPEQRRGAFGFADAKRVDAAAQRAIEDLRLPGISIGVVSGDSLVYAKGFGYADIESGRPHDPTLRQRIGSSTVSCR